MRPRAGAPAATHRAAVLSPPAGGAPRLDWLVALACAWFQAGAYLDAWAHRHRPELETFFTPWHAVLYSGYLAAALLLVATTARSRVPGRPWREAVPDGYGAALAGAGLFALGGVGDMVWHELFGVEVDIEALLSPTHLVLAVGSTLIFAGPLAAAWRRTGPATWRDLGPAVLSLGFVLSSFTFWTQYAQPLARPWPAPGNRPTAAVFPVAAADPLYVGREIPAVFVAQGFGLTGLLLQSLILAGLVLLAVRRWGASLPAGTLTVVFTLNAVLMGLTCDQVRLVPAAFLGGVLADVLLVRLRPAAGRATALRAFAALVPALYFLAYFAVLALDRGVWWSLPLWSGAVVVAGLAGLILSYLAAPPSVASSWQTGSDALR